MIPAGYMAKRVVTKPEYLHTEQVEDIYSVSDCISEAFSDYMYAWQHNDFWLFDSPAKIQTLAQEQGVNLDETRLFYYEVYEYQFDERNGEWQRFSMDESLPDAILAPPADAALEGYDVVSFGEQNLPECSYLSCNLMAEEIDVNAHCLLDSFDSARALVEARVFNNCEPGPCRIFAVYSLDWPEPMPDHSQAQNEKGD